MYDVLLCCVDVGEVWEISVMLHHGFGDTGPIRDFGIIISVLPLPHFPLTGAKVDEQKNMYKYNRQQILLRTQMPEMGRRARAHKINK